MTNYSTEDFLIHIDEGELYIPIPLEIAEKASIFEGSLLSLDVEDGKITLTKNKT